jgi:hypothetical protein
VQRVASRCSAWCTTTSCNDIPLRPHARDRVRGATCKLRRAACNRQRAAVNMHPAACNRRHAAYNLRQPPCSTPRATMQDPTLPPHATLPHSPCSMPCAKCNLRHAVCSIPHSPCTTQRRAAHSPCNTPCALCDRRPTALQRTMCCTPASVHAGEPELATGLGWFSCRTDARGSLCSPRSSLFQPYFRMFVPLSPSTRTPYFINVRTPYFRMVVPLSMSLDRLLPIGAPKISRSLRSTQPWPMAATVHGSRSPGVAHGVPRPNDSQQPWRDPRPFPIGCSETPIIKTP